MQQTKYMIKPRSTSKDHQEWNKILALHIRLINQFDPMQVTQEIERIVKESFYPMEECLKICREFNQMEAQALLSKKIGNYQHSIALYLEILYSDLNKERLKKELYYLHKETLRHSDNEREKLFALNQAKFKQAQSD